jgi:hypothetical protein
MGRNEVKLRRQIINPDDIHRHRNYSALMKQFERTRRFKRALRLFVYSLLITVVVLLFLFGVTIIIINAAKKKGAKNVKTAEKTEWTTSDKHHLG